MDNQSSSKPLKILIVAAEVVPFAKVGGLADVAGALPIALNKLGHDVRVVMPKYGRIDNAKFNLKPLVEPFPVPMDGHSVDVDILEGSIAEHIPVYFVHNEHYFDREGIYSYPDDDERFILYCRAAVEMLKKLNWRPDIIHCNDWQTAIIPNWLKTIYKDDPFFSKTASLYTIHNLAYQGVFGQRVLEIAGIAE
ncbi:MAG: starch synthase, partial [Candidatus Chloroheliales bacterium]